MKSGPAWWERAITAAVIGVLFWSDISLRESDRSLKKDDEKAREDRAYLWYYGAWQEKQAHEIREKANLPTTSPAWEDK